MNFTRIAILLIALLASCGKGSEPPKSSTRVFRMNINREPPTMDPRRGSELVGSAMHFIVFEGLIRLNPDGTPTPAQAKSVEISDDRKTYTFHLRETFWSNGDPVTATDFERAWKKILSPDFPAASAHLLYGIKNGEAAKRGEVSLDEVGIHVINEKTLVVELTNPAPYFLDLVSFCVFYPVNHKIDEQNPNWAFEAGPAFITNGPFKLVSWKHNNELVFEKNPLYWEANQISLDQIYVSMVNDENTALSMFENNELDIIGHGISRIPSEVVHELYQKGRLQIQDSAGTSVVWFNNDKYPFHNKNIRKAFAYAINRQEIVENITQLGEEIATNIIPPILNRNKKPLLFKDNDTSAARAFFQKGLEELGITAQEFPLITYHYSISDANHKLAQVLQSQWANVLGITVALQNTEHKVLLDKLSSRSYEIAQSYWVAHYYDPLNILERFASKENIKNYPHWHHPEYVRLLEKSAVDLTSEERFKTFEAAEALLIEEMPLAPLYHWKSAFMMKPHFSLPNLSPSGPFDYTRLCTNSSKEHDESVKK